MHKPSIPIEFEDLVKDAMEVPDPAPEVLDSVRRQFVSGQIDTGSLRGMQVVPQAIERKSLMKTIHVNLHGEKICATKSRFFSKVAIATLMIIALLAVAFLTPQGRAFAQSIIQFFTRTENTSFPLQPSQIAADETEPAEPTAAPTAPLISVAEAEGRAGFNIAELPTIPKGLSFLGARLYGNAISVEYEAQGGGGSLSIMQSPDGFYQSEWDRVPADAIVPAKIGDLDGEFVQGTFVVYAGETSAKWSPDAPILRLRWMRDGIWFEMTKFGDVESIEYLDQAGMITLAESLVYTP